MVMKSTASQQFAVIGDLVGSRRSASRAEVQRGLVDALALTNEVVPAAQPLAPTIGDEFQGVHDDLGSALRATLVVRLALPDGVDCRCGVGLGTLENVGTSEYGHTQDGPAWWAARDAIVEAKRRESGRTRRLRTWFLKHDREGGGDVGLVNAYLLCRDDVVGRLDARQRRLALGLLRGTSQKDLAAAEGISASAVSQSLHRSGAFALVQAAELVAP